MKRFSIAVALTMALLLFLAGCAKPVNEILPEREKPGDYFPLTMGSRWEYIGEGNEFASFKREVVFTDNNRAQFKEDNGGTVSAAVFEITDAAIIRTFFQGEDYNDIDFLDHQPTENTVILKVPLEQGTKWEVPGSTREIVSTDEVVNAPAGRFEDCIKVEIPSQNASVYEYFHKGTGLVKREFISEDGTAVTSTLEKVTIK